MEYTVNKQHMDAVKALADIGLEVSEASNRLFKLKEVEASYMVEREAEAVKRIEKALEGSKDLIDEAASNYELIHQFSIAVREGGEFLEKAYKTFHEMVSSFEEKQALWQTKMTSQEEKLEETRNMFKAEAKNIEARKKTLESEKKKLDDRKIKIDDERATLERAINRLKLK